MIWVQLLFCRQGLAKLTWYTFCIPENFNTNNSHKLFDYKITFVNSQREKRIIVSQKYTLLLLYSKCLKKTLKVNCTKSESADGGCFTEVSFSGTFAKESLENQHALEEANSIVVKEVSHDSFITMYNTNAIKYFRSILVAIQL